MELISELKDGMGNKFFSMLYSEEGNYLYCKWEGQTVSADIYAGSEEQLDWTKENAAAKKCKAVVNDCRLLVGSLVDTTDWATNVWSPAMYNNGILYNAILQSDDIFSQLSLDAFEEISAGAGHIVNKLFNNQSLAEEWIKSKY